MEPEGGVYHRIYKSPPPVPILNQTDPVCASPSNLSKIYFNIILPSLLNIVCVLFSIQQVLSEIFFLLRLVFSELHATCAHKRVHVWIWGFRYNCLILTKTGVWWQILVKLSNIKFDKNPFRGSRILRANRRIDVGLRGETSRCVLELTVCCRAKHFCSCLTENTATVLQISPG